MVCRPIGCGGKPLRLPSLERSGINDNDQDRMTLLVESVPVFLFLIGRKQGKGPVGGSLFQGKGFEGKGMFLVYTVV